MRLFRLGTENAPFSPLKTAYEVDGAIGWGRPP